MEDADRDRADRGAARTRFRWLWSSAGLSGLADGITRILLPLLVVAEHPQPMALAGLTVATMAPWLLFALPAGVLVDRYDRRLILLCSNGVRALALVAGMAVCTLTDALPILYALGFTLGMAETLADTAAPAILPQIVPSEHLERANSRIYAQQVITGMAAPPLAALLVGAGALPALGAGGSLYAAAAVLVLGLAAAPAARRAENIAGRSMWRDIRTGTAFVLAHPALARTLAVSALYAIVFAATGSMLVLLSYQTLGLVETGYGLLLTIGSIGSIAGTWIAPRLTARLPLLTVAGATLVLSGLAYVVLGVSSSVAVAGIALFCNGIFVMSWNIPMLSLRQRLAPPELQGRVMSVSRLCSWGMMPIGAVFGGVLAEAASVGTVFVTAGVVLIVGSIALLAPLRSEELI
ncbi:MFS transporter [Nocardia amamiensis]|uniref:MFS transporter n=1 Tax=Nocardia amamiensis TaxID=404578 RepID=UPI002480E437|nr:MFS transporter [Nocardia amamiensis]